MQASYHTTLLRFAADSIHIAHAGGLQGRKILTVV